MTNHYSAAFHIRFKKYIFTCMLLSLGVFILLFDKGEYWFPSTHSTTLSSPKPQRKKVILLWNNLFTGFSGYNFSLCPVSNCILTWDKSRLNQSDAVVIPGVRKLKKVQKSFPPIRPGNQPWIYYKMESQVNSLSDDNLKFMNGKINFTMTILTESDIFAGYAKFGIKKAKNPRRKMQYHPANRSNIVAWLVSHCGTQSKREVYFSELSKHIQADQFGRCSPNAECQGNCLDYISRNYKFYFAAENSLCRDYITEKVFRNALAYGMVPIVYGGANYSKFLPPQSYIDVKDFHSPKELAAFLKILDRNDTLYDEYFKWKEELVLEHTTAGVSLGVCNLCKFLNTKVTPKVYTNMHRFWSKTDCISSQQYLSSVMQ